MKDLLKQGDKDFAAGNQLVLGENVVNIEGGSPLRDLGDGLEQLHPSVVGSDSPSDEPNLKIDR